MGRTRKFISQMADAILMRFTPPLTSTQSSSSRRRFLERTGAVVGAFATTSVAGCSMLGADHASYWSDSAQVDADYDSVLATARDAGYTVVEPYYVGDTRARGIHPEGFGSFDERFGPDYRVFGFTFYPESTVFVEFWLTDDVPTVTLGDERGTDEFDIASIPPESWLIERLTLAFDVDEDDAREYAADLRGQAAEGTSNPKVGIDAPVTFDRVYEAIETERTDVTASATGGDGWYREISNRDGQRFVTVDFVVQSMEIRREDGDRTYVLKLDRLGGFYLQVTLPVGEEIAEDEYRSVFRQLFEDVGLPPDVVDDLSFEYSSSVW